MSTRQRNRPGRPKGSTTGRYERVNGELTRCAKCGSTEREPYFGRTEHEIAGVQGGQPYTLIVWRRTRCRGCGQVRIDRTFENRKPKGKPKRKRR